MNNNYMGFDYNPFANNKPLTSEQIKLERARIIQEQEQARLERKRKIEELKKQDHREEIELQLLQKLQNEEEKPLFNTTQNNAVIPTKELIKQKNTDFRTLLGISAISNCDNITIAGANNRYCSIRKVDRNMEKLCKTIGISSSQFRKHLRVLLKQSTDEFKIIEKEFNGEKVLCYEINYTAGGFVNIPMDKVESLLVGGSNNCIKLYANLLWLCTKDGEFIERELTQDHLAELMGLSPSTQKVVRIATKWLEGAGLIKTRKVWESETILVGGMPQGSKPKSKIYYSIVV